MNTKQIILFLSFSVAGIIGCNRHDVGDEKANPAPSSSLTLAQAQILARNWVCGDLEARSWSVPEGTSSMVPYLDSRSVLLLERVTGPVQVHDLLVMNEGLGRENICHRVEDMKDGCVLLEGVNSPRADGWIPLTAVKWRVVAIIYSRG